MDRKHLREDAVGRIGVHQGTDGLHDLVAGDSEPGDLGRDLRSSRPAMLGPYSMSDRAPESAEELSDLQADVAAAEDHQAGGKLISGRWTRGDRRCPVRPGQLRSR